MSTRQRGYALSDALIAAAISAGVAITTAQSLGIAARGSQATNDLEEVVSDAEIIAARLDAGVAQPALLKGFKDWEVQSNLIELDNDSPLPTTLQLRRIKVTYRNTPEFSFERIVLSEQ